MPVKNVDGCINMKTTRKIILLGLAFLSVVLVMSMFVNNVSALTIIIDENAPTNSLIVHPANWNETKTFEGDGSGLINNWLVTTSTSNFTQVSNTTLGNITYTSADFTIDAGWTYSWITPTSSFLTTYGNGRVYDTTFDPGDKIRNARFNVTKEYFGGTYGRSNHENTWSMSSFGTWYYPNTLLFEDNTWGSHTDTYTSNGVFQAFQHTNWAPFLIYSGTYVDYLFNTTEIDFFDNLTLLTKYAEIRTPNTGIGTTYPTWGYIDVYNYRVGGWDRILDHSLTWEGDGQNGGWSGSLPPYFSPSVNSWQYRSLTWKDASTLDANSYISTYPNVNSTGGNVYVRLMTAQYHQTLSFLPIPCHSGYIIDQMDLEAKGHNEINDTETVPLSINGYSNGSGSIIYAPDTYDVIFDDEYGPYVFNDTHYGMEVIVDFGKLATLTGQLYYENTNAGLKLVCGTLGGSWTLSLTQAQLEKSINGTGHFLQNWTHEISSVPQSSQIYVDATYYFNTTHKIGEPDFSSGILSKALSYQTNDLAMSLNGYAVNSSVPTLVKIQTIDVTSLTFFTPEDLYPYGTLQIPIGLSFLPQTTPSVLVDMQFDVTPPAIPSAVRVPTTAFELDGVIFQVVPATGDDLSYVFMVYTDSELNTYVIELPKDIGGDFNIELGFFQNTYVYHFYLVDSVGNVRTTSQRTLVVTIQVLAQLNITGLLSWIAVIAAAGGGALILWSTGKAKTWHYLLIIGAAAAGLVVMSVFGYFPVALNLLAVTELAQALPVLPAIIGYTVLGVGIAAAIIGGYFLLRWLLRPDESEGMIKTELEEE